MPEPRRSYRPRNRELVNEHIAAILKVFNRQMELIYIQDEMKDSPGLFIMFRPTARGISLTHLTRPEFDALRKFWELAFALAEPVVDELDKRAKDAYENGNDDFERLYRQPPVFAVRERVLNQYREGLPSGLDGIPRLDDNKRLDYLRWYGAGEGVVGVPDGSPADAGPENDHSQDDSAAGVCEGGGGGASAGPVPGTEGDQG